MDNVLYYVSDEEIEKRFAPPELGNAGWDLRAVERCKVPAGASVSISTAVHFAIPSGWVGVIKERSGLARYHQIYIHGGVIDASYRGEIQVLLENGGEHTYNIGRGDRIAQMLIIPYLGGGTAVSSLDQLPLSLRGASGFGSSGNK